MFKNERSLPNQIYKGTCIFVIVFVHVFVTLYTRMYVCGGSPVTGFYTNKLIWLDFNLID